MKSIPTTGQVRKLIAGLGMTHQEIADTLGVSRSAVDKWTGESDSRDIPMPAWILLQLLADQHPTHRLTKRRR